MIYGENSGLRDLKVSQWSSVRADFSRPSQPPYSLRELLKMLAVVPLGLLFAWGFIHFILFLIQ